MADPKLNTTDTFKVDKEIVSQQDFSLIGLVSDADMVVIIVMLFLVFLSIWCWQIIFQKYFSFKKEKKTMDVLEVYFSNSDIDLDKLDNHIKNRLDNGVLNSYEVIYYNARKDFLKVTSKGQIINVENFSNKLESTLSSSITTERQKYEHNMTVLASIGSISPFIGLFGTVWGIMNSFQSIAMSNNTSLAVVAPGIAEALFATALGLLAAIPAVAAYNKFLKDIDNLNDRAENFAQLILLYFIDEIEKK